MVIVRLVGGLGNQLFQYAAARRIAHVNATSLKLDISWFGESNFRTFNLNHFAILEEFASSQEIVRLRGSVNRISRLVKKYFPTYRSAWLAERHFHFDPNLLNSPGDVYLDGYWQSEKYFKDIAAILRAELAIKTPPDAANLHMAQHIRTEKSVSLHIRHGDYASVPTTRRVHGPCSLEYYFAAAKILTQRISNAHFFVFSDEPHWAQSNLRLEYPTTFVTHNSPAQNYEDLRLMSMCQHHIIANSSFSWWGAWLCQNPDKLVYAPSRWFAKSNRDARDLIPAGWHSI